MSSAQMLQPKAADVSSLSTHIEPRKSSILASQPASALQEQQQCYCWMLQDVGIDFDNHSLSKASMDETHISKEGKESCSRPSVVGVPCRPQSS